MKFKKIACSLLVLIAPFIATSAEEGGVNQYKFRLGKWKIESESYAGPNKTIPGSALSETYKIMNGRGYSAHYHDPKANMDGITNFIYSKEQDNWALTYTSVNGKGQTNSVVFSSKMENGVLTERFDGEDRNGAYIAKATYTNIKPASFVYTIYRSYDQGKNWITIWTANFLRQ